MGKLFNEDMVNYGTNRSSIRELFEFGKKRALEVGADKVYDYSLGNPNVPAPESVRKSLERIVAIPDTTLVHGYTSAPGDLRVRNAVANNIKTRFGVDISADYIYMTCGAAASLCISLRALNTDNNEFIILAPFFPEYKVFTLSAGGTPVVVPYSDETRKMLVILPQKGSKMGATISLRMPSHCDEYILAILFAALMALSSSSTVHGRSSRIRQDNERGQ